VFKGRAPIALYHKSKDWKSNVVVIDGTVLGPKGITIWEEMEQQLTGRGDMPCD